MTYENVVQFPFIDFGILLVLIAFAIQMVRGRLTGGVLEFIKASKGMFDQDSDALVIQLAQRFHREPGEVRKFIENIYLLSTGEPLNAEAQATLDMKVRENILGKDIPPAPHSHVGSGYPQFINTPYALEISGPFATGSIATQRNSKEQHLGVTVPNTDFPDYGLYDDSDQKLPQSDAVSTPAPSTFNPFTDRQAAMTYASTLPESAPMRGIGIPIQMATDFAGTPAPSEEAIPPIEEDENAQG